MGNRFLESLDNKHDEQTMLDLIIKRANEDERIRAVILNGSRVSPTAIKDIFSDYDVIYIVNDVIPFVENQKWVNHFGKTLIMQKPDEMDEVWESNKNKFTFLMRFEDGNRIDVTLIKKDAWKDFPKDSQSKLLLDKDNIIGALDDPSDKDYLPSQLIEKEFKDCCNEFLWVSTYVAKGIWRQQLPYAKYMAENNVKQQLIKLLEWNAAIDTKFNTPIGQYGKLLEKHTELDIWNKFIQTYVGSDYEDMWNALLLMCELFDELAEKIAKHYGYEYDKNEYNSVLTYLNEIHSLKQP